MAVGLAYFLGTFKATRRQTFLQEAGYTSLFFWYIKNVPWAIFSPPNLFTLFNPHCGTS
jgi:hypothetical protein